MIWVAATGLPIGACLARALIFNKLGPSISATYRQSYVSDDAGRGKRVSLRSGG